MAVRKTRIIAVLIIIALALIFLTCLPVSAGNFTTWTSINSGTAKDLYGVWGPTNSDIFAVGSSGTIMHYDGSAWSSMNGGNTGDLYCVWGSRNNDVFAVGISGNIMHYDGSAWSSMNRNTIDELHAVWGFSSADVFTVGWSGTILQYIPPIITSISQDHGDQGATLNIIITGTNFTGASEVLFGKSIAVNSFTVLSSSQITANITIVAGAAPGTRDVTVTTPSGSFTSSNCFTVKQALPVIESISPDNGSQGATLRVIITGRNLNGVTSVSMGAGVIIQSFTNLSPTQLKVNVVIDEKAVPGMRDVSVTTSGGISTLGNS